MKRLMIAFITLGILITLQPHHAFAWSTNTEPAAGIYWTLDQLKQSSTLWISTPNPFAENTNSFYVTTHPFLTLRIIDIFEKRYSIHLADWQKRALVWGSIEEDYDRVNTSTELCYADVAMSEELWGSILPFTASGKPTFNRSLNHFIGIPDTHGIPAPLTDWSWAEGFVCAPDPEGNLSSSLIWANGDNRNRMSYENLRTLGDTEEAWTAIGHILHLLQDASSPAHTRNDAHPGKDSYENTLAGMTPFDHQNLVGVLNSDRVPQYSRIEDYFNNLAKYTREHYFSDDTVFSNTWSGMTLPPVNYSEDDYYFYNTSAKKIAKKNIIFEVQRLSYIAHGYGVAEACELAKPFASLSLEVISDGFPDLGSTAILFGAGLLRVCLNELDRDADGVSDSLDNCEEHFNPGQLDLDKDEIGDACDTQYDGDYTIRNQVDLENLSGYKYIKGSLEIASTSLTDLTGLENLIIVAGSLAIYDNPYLTNLNGLEGLTYLTTYTSDSEADLFIWKNDSLANLNGLRNLSKVQDTLQIEGNSSLTNLGLDELGFVGGDLRILDNSSLPTSLAESLVSQVLGRLGVGGDIDISGNLYDLGPSELEGIWIMHDAMSPDGELILIFSGTTWQVIGFPFGGTFRVDGRTDPHQIDLTFNDAPDFGVLGGTLLGLYKIENEILTLAVAMDNARPTSFTPSDSLSVLISEPQSSNPRMPDLNGEWEMGAYSSLVRFCSDGGSPGVTILDEYPMVGNIVQIDDEYPANFILVALGFYLGSGVIHEDGRIEFAPAETLTGYPGCTVQEAYGYGYSDGDSIFVTGASLTTGDCGLSCPGGSDSGTTSVSWQFYGTKKPDGVVSQNNYILHMLPQIPEGRCYAVEATPISGDVDLYISRDLQDLEDYLPNLDWPRACPEGSVDCDYSTESGSSIERVILQSIDTEGEYAGYVAVFGNEDSEYDLRITDGECHQVSGGRYILHKLPRMPEARCYGVTATPISGDVDLYVSRNLGDLDDPLDISNWDTTCPEGSVHCNSSTLSGLSPENVILESTDTQGEYAGYIAVFGNEDSEYELKYTEGDCLALGVSGQWDMEMEITFTGSCPGEDPQSDTWTELWPMDLVINQNELPASFSLVDNWGGGLIGEGIIDQEGNVTFTLSPSLFGFENCSGSYSELLGHAERESIYFGGTAFSGECGGVGVCPGDEDYSIEGTFQFTGTHITSFRPPSNVHAEYDSVHRWNLISWAETQGATEYYVYWGTSPGVTKSSNVLPATSSTEFAHSGVLPGWTYCYRVASSDGVRQSGLSDQVCVAVTQVINPTVSVTPPEGPIGTLFNEPGTGFTAFGGVTLHFIDPNGNHTTIPKVADGTGAYPHSYQSHSGSAVGQWRYYAVDDMTGITSPSVYFMITPPAFNPQVSVTPNRGPRGTVFNEPGSGFTPGGFVTLHFVDPSGVHSTIPKTADSLGTFSHTYQSYSGTAIGQWRYYAVDYSTGISSPSAYFTITAPSVSVSPTSGPRGTTFNEPGSGFTPNGGVTLHFIDPNGIDYTIAKVADNSGGYTHVYTTDAETAVGQWRYYAVDIATGTSSVSVYFTITGPSVNPQVSVSPTSGPRGTSFSEPGSGFTPNGGVTLHFIDPSGIDYTIAKTANSLGAYSHVYPTNSGTAIGQWRYYAVDNTTGRSSLPVYFSLTAPTVSVSPSTGPRGTTFNEPGSGFTQNGGVTLHFIDPSGIDYTIAKTANSSGAYSHTYPTNSGTATGQWRYYAIDNATGTSSNSVYYTITP